MRRYGLIAFVLAANLTRAAVATESGVAEARAEACKKAMNERIQTCTDDCTKTALAAASDYKDTNNNVKFGCMKGCAIRQVFQMQVCRDGGNGASGGSVETNQH